MMKHRKIFSLAGIFILIAGNSILTRNLFAQAEPQGRSEDSFSVKGLITKIDATTKTLHVKNEGGLELTYRVDDSTQIEIAEEPGKASGRPLLFSELAANDPLEISYRYNENYEKIALSVQKQPKKTAAAPPRP